MSKGEKQFYTMIASLLALIVATVVVFMLGYHGVASDLGAFGTPLLMLGWMLYAIHDAASRWPGTSLFQRYVNIITFKR